VRSIPSPLCALLSVPTRRSSDLNASRRELVAGGMSENKVLRVVGLSSAVLFDAKNPYNPVNRRISIIVMNKKTEESITKENTDANVADGAEAKQAVDEAVNLSGVVQPGTPQPAQAPQAPLAPATH